MEYLNTAGLEYQIAEILRHNLGDTPANLASQIVAEVRDWIREEEERDRKEQAARHMLAYNLQRQSPEEG